MSERGTGKRTQTHEIAIAAPVEAVWKAITDAEELTRWFVEAAKVEPGVGGSFWISWGGAEEGESRIEVWEPNQKLRVALKPFDMGPAKYDVTSPMRKERRRGRRDSGQVASLVDDGLGDRTGHGRCGDLLSARMMTLGGDFQGIATQGLRAFVASALRL